MRSGGTGTAILDNTVSDTKEAKAEARYEAEGVNGAQEGVNGAQGVIAGEEVTDSVMKPVAIEAGKRRISGKNYFALYIPLNLSFPQLLSMYTNAEFHV